MQANRFYMPVLCMERNPVRFLLCRKGKEKQGGAQKAEVGALKTFLWQVNKHIQAGLFTLQFLLGVHTSPGGRSCVVRAAEVPAPIFGLSVSFQGIWTNQSEFIGRGVERTRDF